MALATKNGSTSTMVITLHSGPDQVRAFFAMVITSEVGNDEHVLFWTDRWLQGQKISDLAPHLFAVVPPARRKKRTVKEAFTNHDWVVDIQGALTLNIITEYIQLWDLVHGF
jgi:hypothetical protein